jgi:hypothetical protein
MITACTKLILSRSKFLYPITFLQHQLFSSKSSTFTSPNARHPSLPNQKAKVNASQQKENNAIKFIKGEVVMTEYDNDNDSNNDTRQLRSKNCHKA